MPTTSMDKAGWVERLGVCWANGRADDATAAGTVAKWTVCTAGGEATAWSRLYATTVMVLVPGVSTNDFVSTHLPGSGGTGAIVWTFLVPPRFATARPTPVSAVIGAALWVQSTFPIPPPCSVSVTWTSMVGCVTVVPSAGATKVTSSGRTWRGGVAGGGIDGGAGGGAGGGLARWIVTVACVEVTRSR